MFRLPYERLLRRPLLSTVLFVAGALSAGVVPAFGASALDVVRDSNEQVLAIYESGSSIDAAAEERIFAIIDGVTDYEALADGATDRSCRKLSAEECGVLREVFIELLRVSAVKKLGRYRADSFEYAGEEMTGDGAVVDTVAVFGEERVSLVYHLAPSGDSWRIVNYIVDDVDTVRNYRKQFQRLFGSESFAAVVQRLRDRIEAYRAEGE
jgi:phospholipid transport system substrate-binding protein